jgi:hypothetical protein
MHTPSYAQIQHAAKLAVAAFDLDPQHAHRLQASVAGAALLTLLANVAAKQFPDLAAEYYAAKVVLLNLAICLATDWWATPHAYGDYADTVVYIETQFARFAFHCRKGDPALADLLATAPASERGWSGLSLQAYAVQLVEGYLSGSLSAAQIIARTAANQEPAGDDDENNSK